MPDPDSPAGPAPAEAPPAAADADLDPAQLPAALLGFCEERHLATLTSLRPDGSPHVVPVGFTYEPERRLLRVITRDGSRKVRNLRAADGDRVRGRVALCQVDRARWVTLEGVARVTSDPDEVAEAVRRYAQRYRQPSENPSRVALLVEVDRVLAAPPLRR